MDPKIQTQYDMFRIENILGVNQVVKTEKIEIKFVAETSVKLDAETLGQWRDGDMSFADLLKGLMKSQAAEERLRDEFSAKPQHWLDTIGSTVQAVVKANMLKLFEKESSKIFM